MTARPTWRALAAAGFSPHRQLADAARIMGCTPRTAAQRLKAEISKAEILKATRPAGASSEDGLRPEDAARDPQAHNAQAGYSVRPDKPRAGPNGPPPKTPPGPRPADKDWDTRDQDTAQAQADRQRRSSWPLDALRLGCRRR